jgi:phosphoribosylglycinamide formyltransferase-1
MTLHIGWFSTGRDPAARKLLEVGIEVTKSCDAKLSFVFCNRVKGESEESDKFLELAESYGLETICFSSRAFKPELWVTARERWRTEFHSEIMQLLQPYPHELDVLAGYMLIVSEEMCNKYNMINLHPAAPGGPKGTWQEVIWELLERRADYTGVTIHLVTPELDEGPPVTYCKFSIKGDEFEPLWQQFEEGVKVKGFTALKAEEWETNNLFCKIREEGVKRELPMLRYTLEEFARGNLKLEGRKVYVGGKVLLGGYCLNTKLGLSE